MHACHGCGGGTILIRRTLIVWPQHQYSTDAIRAQLGLICGSTLLLHLSLCMERTPQLDLLSLLPGLHTYIANKLPLC